jgi:hypothetical protein
VSCQEFMRALSNEASEASQDMSDHAAHCSQCAGLLEIERALRASQPPLPPAPAFPAELARLLAQHPAKRRSTLPARTTFAVSSALFAAVSCGAIWLPRADLARAPRLPFVLLTLATVCGLQLLAYRGRSGLGVAPGWRWAFAALVAVGFGALSAWQSSHWFGSQPALDCFWLGLAVALVIGLLTCALHRRTAVIGSAATGAVAGGVAGLAAVLFLHVHCSGTSVAHLTLVHGLPLAIAILAGALWGRRWLQV